MSMSSQLHQREVLPCQDTGRPVPLQGEGCGMLFSMRCPSCGWAAEPDHRFCARCGAPLGDRPAKGEERKVVTVVFADLFGFTSRAERLDPEDVHALLKPYYARLRSELERFGGTVEKFIGDAVMAVFGAPTAHEDDPERAVRAALAIRDWLLEQPELQVRIAVNTGEALVALDARPEAGEGMVSGDVINTAARLQATALVNGILVGEAAYRASARVIRYRDAEPVLAKGKRAPLAVWEAIEARSRLGSEVGSVIRTPLVGRDRELRLLTDSLARVGQDRTAQLVTVVGVPGIGKSRLIAELFRAIEHDPTEIIQWRQGRSLPYGDGVTFWVLAEMVKAQAGVLETDAPDQAAAKLRTSIAGVIPDTAEAGWIESHLRPLAGLGAADPGRGDRRQVLHRLASLLRAAGGPASAGADLRGCSLGGRQPPRLHRFLGGALRRRAAPRRLRRAPRAAGTPFRLGRGQAQRGHALAVAALGCGDGGAHQRPGPSTADPGRHPAHPADEGGWQPSLCRAVRAHAG